MAKLKECTEGKGLKFICTAFDYQSILDLLSIECCHIKLPSQLYSDLGLQNKIDKLKTEYNFQIWVSTGMHSANEIFKNDWMKIADVLFHCISVYPACITNMNLNTLRQLVEVRTGVGYSSHENEGLGIKFAVLIGAEYVERHFTLNKEWKGSDHGTVSSDIKEMKRIISEIEYVEQILGTQERLCSLKEKVVRKIYRGKELDEE
jgi:sialic acid synthase SpsE